MSVAAGHTEILFSKMPSPELRSELSDLSKLNNELENREDDVLSRKKMAYAAYSRRRGR